MLGWGGLVEITDQDWVEGFQQGWGFWVWEVTAGFGVQGPGGVWGTRLERISAGFRALGWG